MSTKLSPGTMKQKVVVVLGPTASGKSDLAVRLAKKYNGEVISADSRQVYRGLNIGTGKITKREMNGVRHHLLDVANPKQRFTVTQYVTLAKHAIDDILSRRKLPIICGGTGFYISAVLGNETIPDVPPNLKLRTRLEKKTTSELLRMLQKLDSKRAKNIDSQNKRRIIRAIEIAKRLGTVPKHSAQSVYKVLKIGLRAPKEELKRRIRARLIARMRHGMTAEAKRLHDRGLSWRRMDELGLEYRYLAQHLQGKLTRQEMIEELNTKIWHYAKRQMTWFRKDKNIRWFPLNSLASIEKTVSKYLNQRPKA